MYFCVNEFEVGVNDSILPGNEQQKVYLVAHYNLSPGRNLKRTKNNKLGKHVDFGQGYILCKLFSKIVSHRGCKKTEQQRSNNP